MRLAVARFREAMRMLMLIAMHPHVVVPIIPIIIIVIVILIPAKDYEAVHSLVPRKEFQNQGCLVPCQCRRKTGFGAQNLWLRIMGERQLRRK